MSNKYNLYRVEPDRYLSLLTNFEEAGFKKIGETESVRGFDLTFYLVQGHPLPPSWTKLYQRFIPKDLNLKNQFHSAALVIRNTEHCYVVTIGRAFHPVQKVCDKEFGLNLAERIVDESEVKQKASRFFQSQRSKTIQSFLKNNPFAYDSGESVTYLKARTKEPNLWGEKAEFGVSFRFSSKREPGRLPEVVEEIILQLGRDGDFSFPRTKMVSDEKIELALDQILLDRITSRSDEDFREIEFEDFQLNGCDFKFHDADEFFFHLFRKKKKTISKVDSLSLDALQSYIHAQRVTPEKILYQVRLEAKSPDRKPEVLKLKELLDVVIEHNSKSYCLLYGEWFEFSRSYLDFLNEQIDNMEFETANEFNFIEDKSEADRKGEQGERRRDEEWFLDKVVSKNGEYQQFHKADFSKGIRKMRQKHNVEFMDLARKQELYIVKRGSTQNQGYAIDQAIGTVNLLKELKFQFYHNNKRYRPKKVCIWMVLNRANPIQALSDLKSTIFKMKLVEFKRVAQDAGLQPEIRVSYEVKDKHQQNFSIEE